MTDQPKKPLLEEAGRRKRRLMENGQELRWYLSVLRRWWWLILVCTLVAATSAYALSSWTQPVYSATTTLLVDKAQTGDTSEYSDILASERLANTYSQMLTGRPVLEEVITRLELGQSPDALAKEITVRPVPDTQLIEVSVESTDPATAALVADSIAEEFMVQIQLQQAQRYKTSLDNLRGQQAELSMLESKTRTKIDALRASRSRADADLAYKGNHLAEIRSNHRALEQEYADLGLTVSQLANSIDVFELAQVPESVYQTSYTTTEISYIMKAGDTLGAIARRFDTTVEELMQINGITSTTTIRAGTQITVAHPHEALTEPVYNVTATLLINPVLAPGNAEYSAIMASERIASTYSQLLAARPMLETVIARLELAETPNSLAQRVNVVAVPGTQLMQLSVKDAEPARAALVANTIAEVFVEQVQSMQQEPYAGLLADMQEHLGALEALMEKTQKEIDTLTGSKIEAETELAYQEDLLAEYRSDYRAIQQEYADLQLVAAQSAHEVSVSEGATVPTSPIQPRPLLNTALAAAVGLMVGVGAAFLLEYVDDTIRTPEEVSHELGLSTLGAIGRLANGDPPLVVTAQPRSPIAESFRVLVTNIRYSSLDKPIRTLLVTSPEALSGKSFVVSNLAAAAAQSGLRVVAVDADLRKPWLHRLFDLEVQGGLVDSLLEGKVNGRLQPTQEERLQVLCSGDVLPINPGEMVSSDRMQALVGELAEGADLVVIDSPPVLPVADAVALAPMTDGVLLVLEAGHTRRQATARAATSLRQVGARMVGVVLNRAPSDGAESYYYPGKKEEENKTMRRDRIRAELRNRFRRQA
jgi:non-specific protein-tyrosine kinase